MSIQLFRQTNLFREDIDAWRQDLIQNRGSIIGYLITTKCSHTMRKMNVMQINKRRVRDETCVLLTHKKPTSYIEVTMDYETIVPNQKPGKATYKMITDYVKEKFDLVVKSTTIAEVKRSFGLEVGDYNVKEEKTNYRKEKITPEKRQAVEDALRHFGVIE